MRNKFNANFYEHDKFYNTNQNNTDEVNLDNNRGKKHNSIMMPISEVEIGSEFNSEKNKTSNQSFSKNYDYRKGSKLKKNE